MKPSFASMLAGFAALTSLASPLVFAAPPKKGIAPAANQVAKLELAKSTVEWEGRKVVGPHNGTIALKDGELEVKDGKIVGGKAVIDMTSIKNLDLTDASYNKKLVDHLKSDDFFSVEKFPEALIVVKSVKTGKDGAAEVTADVTIKGITHAVTFPAKTLLRDGLAKVEGELKLDRTKWNVKYNSGKFFDVKALGDKVINDEFKVRFQVQANVTG